MIMAGQFKNAPIGFKPGMRFKTALGWREVLTVRDGTAICWPIGGKAPGFSWVYQEPTETMLLDLDQPWVGRKYKSHDGLVSEVVCMTDKQVFVQWAAETDPCAFTLDFFKKHFTPIPLEPPFKVCSEAIGMMNAAEVERDRWRRTAERLEGEKQEQAKEIEQLKRNGAFHFDVCTAHLRHIKELQKELAEQTEQENRHILMSYNVEQTLGKILCYPWYKDDQKNFPGATEEDGVCVGEDTIETLADRAAERIRHLEEEISALREKLRNQTLRIAELVGENEALTRVENEVDARASQRII